ncbi:PGAP1-domain-containing protein [Dentipellis sp. KUC8613]|nr:PGAP1-domain-containing protein [Dentipellis sp. KUC8613]
MPVLFIPGNAGSSHQVRSIASSAARQFYSSPYTMSPEFSSRGMKPIDFYAVEFNEDLSAFHGPTLSSETAYASHAIDHILSLYPPGTSIILMGHSMGGIVATSILPRADVAALITMSTPHTIPPARFDRRISTIYSHNRRTLAHDPTPILSLCGGAGDLMIPSESCILPSPEAPEVGQAPYRRTIFTSALEGCWTSVGHQVMVWCHQVRWRVARVALELAASKPDERPAVLDHWLSDGSLPTELQGDSHSEQSPPEPHEVVPPGAQLVLRSPSASVARTYFLPVPARTAEITKKTFIVYISQGSILGKGPAHSSLLSVSIHLCRAASPLTDSPSSASCVSLRPDKLQLLPNTHPGRPFPLPNEGIDESDGVVLFEADVFLPEGQGEATGQWVAVSLTGADGHGWILGGFVDSQPITSELSVYGALWTGARVELPPKSVRVDIRLPRLLSHALFVYRATAVLSSASSGACAANLLPPLLQINSPSESHLYPLVNRPALLHSHAEAPFISRRSSHGMNLTLYSSAEPACSVEALILHVDSWGTLGRIATRSWAALPGWALGVVLCAWFLAWSTGETGAPMPGVSQSLELFVKKALPTALAVSFGIALLPLPAEYLLGNSGEAVLAPLAPVLLLVATGLVCVSWFILLALMWPFSRILRSNGREKDDAGGAGRSTLLSMLFVCVLVFFFVPWQVAFLACWILHISTCARRASFLSRVLTPSGTPGLESPTSPSRKPLTLQLAADVHHHSEHILLLMTWLLPLVAPVLAVWVRTLAASGLTTPFDGDHSVLTIAPYLVLIDYASWTRGPLLPRESYEPFSIRWLLLPAAAVAFLIGARRTYEVFDWIWAFVTLIVVVRIGPRYWGRASWSAANS